MTFPSILSMGALFSAVACSGGTCLQRNVTGESSEAGEGAAERDGPQADGPVVLQEAIDGWDGQSLRMNCLFPLELFELPAWD